MPERIQVSPGLDVQAPSPIPSVSLAPVRIKPDPVGAFAEAVTVGLTKYIRGRVGDDGRSILNEVRNSYKETIDKLEKANQLTQQSVNQAQDDAISTLNTSLLKTNVDIDNFEKFRKILESDFKRDNRFTIHEEGALIVERNENVGTVTVKWRNPVEQQAIAINKVLEEMSPAKALHYSTLSSSEQANFVTNIMKNNLASEGIQEEIVKKEAYVKLFQADKETRKLAFEGDYNKLRINTYNSFKAEMDSAIANVKAGRGTADQAVSIFENAFNNLLNKEETFESLKTLGRDYTEYVDGFNSIKQDMIEAIKAFSPEVELTTAALVAQKKVALRQDQVYLGMSEPVFNKLTTLQKLSGVVLSDQLLRVLGKEVSGMEVQDLKAANSSDIRSFATLYDKFAAPDLEQKEDAQTIADNTGTFVARSLININSGYTSGDDPQLIVENVLATVRLLKTSPNYKFINTKIKNIIDKHINILESTIGKADKRIGRLIKKTADDIKSINELYGLED